MRVALPDLAAMEALGARISPLLMPGDVVALSGDLGAGKTTLARAILRGGGHHGEVPSPTFTILETYDELPVPIVHADFYRLEDPAEVIELGLDDYRESAALLAEWPEHAGGFAHEAGCLQISLEIGPKTGSKIGSKIGEQGREAIVELGQSWQSRWS